MGNQDQPTADIKMQEIVITKKLSADGNYIWITSFKDFTTNDEDNNLIPFIDGLGLLEAAKADFLYRHDFGGPPDNNGDD
jgi:hypothetical protein